jgi:hypothetical protein
MGTELIFFNGHNPYSNEKVGATEGVTGISKKNFLNWNCVRSSLRAIYLAEGTTANA